MHDDNNNNLSLKRIFLIVTTQSAAVDYVKGATLTEQQFINYIRLLEGFLPFYFPQFVPHKSSLFISFISYSASNFNDLWVNFITSFLLIRNHRVWVNIIYMGYTIIYLRQRYQGPWFFINGNLSLFLHHLAVYFHGPEIEMINLCSADLRFFSHSWNSIHFWWFQLINVWNLKQVFVYLKLESTMWRQ